MHDDNEGFTVGTVLERYRARLRAVPRLSDYACREAQTLSPTVLWEQALVIAYDALAYAANTGGISKAVLYDEDAIQAVNAAIGSLLGKWQPEKGNLATFLGPRIIGIAKRYRQAERRGGVTGNVSDIAYSDVDEAMDPPTVDDSTVFPEYDQDAPSGAVETLAYAEPPDGYEALPIEALREKLRDVLPTLPPYQRIAVKAFYGVEGKAHGLREIAKFLGLDHPTQVKRIIDEALHKLQILVTKP
jgi:RNA polymerase sigma factor (sigma-70 family)